MLKYPTFLFDLVLENVLLCHQRGMTLLTVPHAMCSPQKLIELGEHEQSCWTQEILGQIDTFPVTFWPHKAEKYDVFSQIFDKIPKKSAWWISSLEEVAWVCLQIVALV